MENKSDVAPDTSLTGMLSNPAFAHFFEAHDKLVAALNRFSPAQLIAFVGGMLTMPEWQVSTVRLEVLQHLIVVSARGTKKAKGADFKSWLTELGDGLAGRMEDPSEDVFVSRVLIPGRDCLVFEGLYEASAFQLHQHAGSHARYRTVRGIEARCAQPDSTVE